MKAIKPLKISRLQTNEDFGFQSRVCGLTELLTAERDLPVTAAYRSAVGELQRALLANPVNPFNKATIEAEKRLDAAWGGLNGQAKACLRHPNAERRAVAKEACAVIGRYGNVTYLPVGEKQECVRRILEALGAMGRERLALAFLDEWLDELSLRLTDYTALSVRRTKAETDIEVGIVRRARIAADEAFRRLCLHVNAFALACDEAAYADFIDRLNTMIDDLREVLSARATRRGKKNGTEGE